MPRHFPHWLRSYVEYTWHTEAPTLFHFWTGVWTIAGALRRRVWRDEFYYKYTPNFYIVLVAPAGIVNKSTTLNLGRELLSHVPDVKFGQSSGSWQGLGDDLQQSKLYFKYKNGSGEEEVIPMCALTIAASELGTFWPRKEDEGAMSFLTDAWDGREGTYTHKTKHSGTIEIENAWLNVMGATTPSWVQRNVKEHMIGDGLLSRVVFVYAEQKRNLIALPSRYVTQDLRDTKKKLTEDLIAISRLVGAFRYSDEVYKKDGWMDKWYTKHNLERDPSMASTRYSGYLSRKQGHMIKLAMILAAAQSDNLLIEREHLEEAEKILKMAEVSMITVFETIGGTDESTHVKEMVTIVSTYRWITARDLYINHCFNTMREADFKQALKLGLEGNIFEIVVKNGVRGLSVKKRIVN